MKEKEADSAVLVAAVAVTAFIEEKTEYGLPKGTGLIKVQCGSAHLTNDAEWMETISAAFVVQIGAETRACKAAPNNGRALTFYTNAEETEMKIFVKDELKHKENENKDG